MLLKFGKVLLLLIFIQGLAFAGEQEAIQHYNIAQQALKSGNYADATQYAQLVLQNAGTNRLDLSLFATEILALSANRQQQYEDAAKLYQQTIILAEKQHLPEASLMNFKRMLTGTYINSKQFNKAEPILKEWILFQEKQAQPNTVEVGEDYITLGQLEYNLTHYNGAKKYLKKGLSLIQSQLPETNQWTAAANQYLQSINDREIKGWYEDGLLAFSQGNKEKALYNWNLALISLKSLNLANDARTFDLQQKIAEAQKIQSSQTYLQDFSHPIRRWSDDKKTIVVYIQRNEHIPQWGIDIIQPMIQNALSAWQQALNNKLSFQYTEDSHHYDVKFSWRLLDPRQDTKDTNDMIFGKNIFYTQGEYLTQNDVELYIPPDQSFLPAQQEVYATLLHETGHMMGLTEHSSNPADIMYGHINPDRKKTELSERDIATIQALYKLKADKTNPPHNLVSEYQASW